MSSHLSHPGYRPDIDGLRAVAVLSVVAFHAFPECSVVAGGFVGVDIFFVISGYLISTIIYENLERGTFSFAEFYARRVRRIFPALAVVLLAAYAFGWHSLLADEYAQFGKHLLAGAGFVSNLVLWSEAGYFDNASETKPLLHLWSLGIEEQFYIVWPLLLWLAWRKNFNLLTITLLIGCASFVLNLKGIRSDVTATFYSPLTRFWELLSGSTLAWLTLHRGPQMRRLASTLEVWFGRLIYRQPTAANGSPLADASALAGAILLAWGFWVIDRSLGFPGAWAALPVVGTCLMIAAGPTAWINRTLLANRLAVWFGLISFPLYLWHWPVLAFARIIDSDIPPRTTRIALVLLSIGLAWLTYRFIERPLRFGRHGHVKLTVLVLLMIGIAAVGWFTYAHHGLTDRDVVQMNTTASSGEDGGDGGNIIMDCGIKDDAVRKLFAACIRDKRGPSRYALIGDSKAHVLYTGLIRTSDSRGRWLFIGGTSAHGSPVPLVFPSSPSPPLTGPALEAISGNPEVETVVMAVAIRGLFAIPDGVKGGDLRTYDPGYMDRVATTPHYGYALDGLSGAISLLLKAGKKVVLVADNPALPSPMDCIARTTSLAFIKSGRNEGCQLPASKFREQTAVYRKLLSELKARHGSAVDVFDPTDIYCDAATGTCGPTRNGRILYAYTDHISDYAAGLVGVELNEFLNSR